jgi:hypothetical protein
MRAAVRWSSSVFDGNVSDGKTLMRQVTRLHNDFGIRQVELFGDCGVVPIATSDRLTVGRKAADAERDTISKVSSENGNELRIRVGCVYIRRSEGCEQRARIQAQSSCRFGLALAAPSFPFVPSRYPPS